MESLNKKFMDEIGRTKDPIVFLGVAKVLRVEVFEDGAGGKNPRDFSDIFADVMFAYNGSARKFKKELLKILRDANKVKGDVNGDFAKDTQKTTSDENL